MRVKILAIANQPITPQALTIFLLKDQNGSLMILSVQQDSAEELKAEEATECASWPVVCKWRQIVANKLTAMRTKFNNKKPGCHKGRPQVTGDEVDKRPHHRPFQYGKAPKGHHTHHGHHRHHHKIHRLIHFMVHTVINIVVPIFVGVAAGIVTYMAGMIIGMTAALLWARFRGRGQYSRIALDEESVNDDSDDEGEMAKKSEKEAEAYSDVVPVEVEAEAPPRYEEAAQGVEKEAVN
jgi:hypothetical protein